VSSGLTLPVGVVVLLEVVDEAGLEADDAPPAEDEAPELVHLPKRDWQPVPQYAEVVPHQPYCEQHWLDAQT